jgi:hypothetical protein
MEYAVEMIYAPSFIKTCSDFPKLMGGGIHRHTGSVEIA